MLIMPRSFAFLNAVIEIRQQILLSRVTVRTVIQRVCCSHWDVDNYFVEVKIKLSLPWGVYADLRKGSTHILRKSDAGNF